MLSNISLQNSWCKKLKAVLVACTLSLFTLHPVWADDTEIYFNSVHSSSAKPNLLFILDASLSMNWFDCDDGTVLTTAAHCNDGTDNGTISRLDRMRAAMKQVLAELSNDLNVGIMRFGGYDGGRVIYPITDLATPGAREELDAVIQDIVAVVGTPTVGALEETWRYFSGLPVNHGTGRAITNRAESRRNSRVSHPDTYTGGSVTGRVGNCDDDNLNSINCEDERITGTPVYNSPVSSECQSNYAILLSDGEPYVGTRRNVLPAYHETVNLIEEFNGGNCSAAAAADAKGETRHGLCGVEIAAHMRGPGTEPTSEDITTHAIGFNIKSDWIKNVATAGGGEYIEAESSTDLVDAIDDILSQVSESGTTVVAPSVAVDQFTRLSHRKEAYLALFKPQATAKWVGNLKKYKFGGVNPSLKDQDGNEAIDAATGNFRPESRSFWSARPDGADVVFGGAASNLNPATRRIISNLDSTTNTELLETAMPQINPNEIHEDNALLTDAMLGIGVAPNDAAAGAGQVCYFDNADWTWTGNRRAGFRTCAFERGVTNFNQRRNHNNTVSAVSVGTGVHTIIYDDRNGNGESLCISSDTDNSALSSMIDRASSFIIGNGECPGQNFDNQLLERETLVSWLRGVDVQDQDGDEDTTDARNHIGDPLHSNPVVVSYGVEPGETLDPENLNSLVFFGTNEGFLHAIDSNDGTEEYAFMPRELLSNLPRLFTNSTLARTEIKPYGLDGGITLRTIDTDNDGLIESNQGDKAYLYVGMRRGGRNYYALDVSVKGRPKFMWSINGGIGDFAELGQSWSKPTLTKVKLGNDVKDVLVFAGGYDPSQDTKTVRSADIQGRAIFMIDADSGELIWGAGPFENPLVSSNRHYAFDNMDYSIPANLAIVPDASTGYLSQMYVGDMGGQLWRFDINNGSSGADLVDGGIIADFGEDNVEAGARRFYGTPDLSLTRGERGDLVLNIAIGSGYRAHPLNMAVDDKFFVLRYPFAGYGDNYGIRQSNNPIVQPTDTYEPALLSDLFDTTDNLIGQGSDDEIEDAREDLAESEGWFITMEDSGEKILDSSSTFEGVVRFVSYVPAVPTGPCDPNLGNSFFYAVNLADGTPFEGIQAEDDSDRTKNLKEFRKHAIPTQGIAPPISTIFVENQGEITPTDVSGVNTVHEWDNIDLIRRWFWAESPE